MVVQVRKIYSLGEFTLDPDKKLLIREDRPVHLANRPFQVLLHLVENRERMVSRAELLDLFWDGKDVYENTLTKCVGTIRKALGDTLDEPRFIETQWAKGYRFIGTLGENYSQARQTSTFEFEPNYGFQVVVEEEYLEILPDMEAVTEGSLIVETTASTIPADTRTALSGNRTLPTSLLRPKIAFALGIVLVTLAALLWLCLRQTPGAGDSDNRAVPGTALPISSIAVLPLKNLSDDPANEYFSDGLTETFITELAKIERLKVISRNSVFTFKGKDIDPREVGRRLDVAAVLEGSVRKSGDTVRVDVRLVNTRDGSIIWSGNTYDRDLQDILAVQDEIACSVAAGLRVRLCTETAGFKHYTSNVEAYQAYLKGRYHWNKRSAEGIEQSIEYFQQAISLDANYALAYAGLADSYIQGIWHVPFDPKVMLPKAKAAASRAVQLDDALAESHTALGNIYQMEWQWARAGEEFARALELNPGLARAHHVQAFHLDIMGNHPQAVRAIKQAQALDPLSLMINSDLSYILWHAGYHEEAIAQALKVIEMDPGFVPGHTTLTALYEFQGKEKEAAEEYFKYLTLSGKSEAVIRSFRRAYAKKGVKGIYETELAELLGKRAKGGYGSPIRLSQLYLLMGQTEAAFRWLDFAVADHNAESAIIRQSPYYKPLQADPRYTDLLRRLGLTGS
jgi:TolB-like protein/DNA-binding winged helix-turn-helix (wHTH) protein